jgi:hypothetical protein
LEITPMDIQLDILPAVHDAASSRENDAAIHAVLRTVGFVPEPYRDHGQPGMWTLPGCDTVAVQVVRDPTAHSMVQVIVYKISSSGFTEWSAQLRQVPVSLVVAAIDAARA